MSSLSLKTEQAKNRARINGERIAKLKEAGKTMKEISLEVGYHPVYCGQLLNYWKGLQGSKEIQSDKVSVEPVQIKAELPIENFRAEDTGLVSYLYMNHVFPIRFDYKPGTNFLYFEYDPTSELRFLTEAFYEGANVAACEYSRANRYVFSLIKRFQRGERVSFAGVQDQSYDQVSPVR